MRRSVWGQSGARRQKRGNPLQLVAVLALIAVIAVVAGLLQPQSSIAGRAEAIDGDTLRIGSTRIRLIGLDAPELDQTCTDVAGKDWPCGVLSRYFVQNIVANGHISCVRSGKDRYGRTLAKCAIGDTDLGTAIVSAGWAVAEPDYLLAQLGARAAGRGIWAGSFEQPADWRRNHGAEPGWWEWLKSWFS